ncbi:MAG TPA: hypothetical protein VK943_09265 [Arenibaculum sp.]|nr:hypothetical protein [Arenibaculum sp.]
MPGAAGAPVFGVTDGDDGCSLFNEIVLERLKMLKFIGGTVGVIFLIGLLVVIGLLALIF